MDITSLIRNKYVRMFVAALFICSLVFSTVQPAAAQAVTATFNDETSAKELVFNVNSGGTYTLHLEGNDPSAYLSSTAVDGVLRFTNPQGNKAWQLENIVVSGSNPNWEMITADGWFKLVAQNTPQQNTAPDASSSSSSYPIDGETSFAGPYSDCGNWHKMSASGDFFWAQNTNYPDQQICQDNGTVQALRNGKTLYFRPNADTFKIDAVWGKLYKVSKPGDKPSNLVTKWTGSYMVMDVTGNGGDWYAFTDDSKAPNAGFRAWWTANAAYDSLPKQNKVTDPPQSNLDKAIFLFCGLPLLIVIGLIFLVVGLTRRRS